jgi:hypothetical protein
MRLERTRFAAEEIEAFLARANDANPLIENYLAQYLLIAFYSETEEVVTKIIRTRLEDIEDSRVASFVYLTNEKMIRRVKKAEINDVLEKFDCGADVIGDNIEERDYQLYSAVITNRHNVSHGEGARMTLPEIVQAIPCAEKIFETMERALRE